MTSEREDHDNWREFSRANPYTPFTSENQDHDNWRNAPRYVEPPADLSGPRISRPCIPTFTRESLFSTQSFPFPEQVVSSVPALEARVVNLEYALAQKNKECEALKDQIKILKEGARVA